MSRLPTVTIPNVQPELASKSLSAHVPAIGVGRSGGAAPRVDINAGDGLLEFILAERARRQQGAQFDRAQAEVERSNRAVEEQERSRLGAEVEKAKRDNELLVYDRLAAATSQSLSGYIQDIVTAQQANIATADAEFLRATNAGAASLSAAQSLDSMNGLVAALGAMAPMALAENATSRFRGIAAVSAFNAAIEEFYRNRVYDASGHEQFLRAAADAPGVANGMFRNFIHQYNSSGELDEESLKELIKSTIAETFSSGVMPKDGVDYLSADPVETQRLAVTDPTAIKLHGAAAVPAHLGAKQALLQARTWFKYLGGGELSENESSEMRDMQRRELDSLIRARDDISPQAEQYLTTTGIRGMRPDLMGLSGKDDLLRDAMTAIAPGTPVAQDVLTILESGSTEPVTRPTLVPELNLLNLDPDTIAQDKAAYGKWLQHQILIAKLHETITGSQEGYVRLGLVAAVRPAGDILEPSGLGKALEGPTRSVLGFISPVPPHLEKQAPPNPSAIEKVNTFFNSWATNKYKVYGAVASRVAANTLSVPGTTDVLVGEAIVDDLSNPGTQDQIRNGVAKGYTAADMAARTHLSRFYLGHVFGMDDNFQKQELLRNFRTTNPDLFEYLSASSDPRLQEFQQEAFDVASMTDSAMKQEKVADLQKRVASRRADQDADAVFSGEHRAAVNSLTGGDKVGITEPGDRILSTINVTPSVAFPPQIQSAWARVSSPITETSRVTRKIMEENEKIMEGAFAAYRAGKTFDVSSVVPVQEKLDADFQSLIQSVPEDMPRVRDMLKATYRIKSGQFQRAIKTLQMVSPPPTAALPAATPPMQLPMQQPAQVVQPQQGQLMTQSRQRSPLSLEQ